MNEDENSKRIDAITSTWMGTNLSKEGLDTLVKDLSGKVGVTQEEHDKAVFGLQKLAATGR